MPTLGCGASSILEGLGKSPRDLVTLAGLLRSGICAVRKTTAVARLHGGRLGLAPFLLRSSIGFRYISVPTLVLKPDFRSVQLDVSALPFDVLGILKGKSGVTGEKSCMKGDVKEGLRR